MGARLSRRLAAHGDPGGNRGVPTEGHRRGVRRLRSALDYFHRENDQRAIFLRAYYLITLAVHQAIYQQGRYQNRIFCDYGGELLLMNELTGDLDDVLANIGLKYYRERVWWTAISFLSATTPEELQLVHAKLDWESAQLAESIACEGSFLQRSLRSLMNLFSKRTFGVITLEREETAPPKKKPEQAISPF